MAERLIYKLYTELLDYRPKIWRRVFIPANIRMPRLAYFLMSIYEMEGEHLFNFYSPERDEYYSLKNTEFAGDFDNDYDIDAASISLKKIINVEGQKIIFTYDFGDSWEISIELEEIINNSECPVKKIPGVYEGKGHGIIEDCGGTVGLEMIAEAFKKKEGQEYEEYCEWFGTKELDLKTFDVDKVNADLKNSMSFLKEIYEGKLF